MPQGHLAAVAGPQTQQVQRQKTQQQPPHGAAQALGGQVLDCQLQHQHQGQGRADQFGGGQLAVLEQAFQRYQGDDRQQAPGRAFVQRQQTGQADDRAGGEERVGAGQQRQAGNGQQADQRQGDDHAQVSLAAPRYTRAQRCASVGR
ncbi:hypothetical protein D9M71_618040 [compost metagenome]